MTVQAGTVKSFNLEGPQTRLDIIRGYLFQLTRKRYYGKVILTVENGIITLVKEERIFKVEELSG